MCIHIEMLGRKGLCLMFHFPSSELKQTFNNCDWKCYHMQKNPFLTTHTASDINLRRVQNWKIERPQTHCVQRVAGEGHDRLDRETASDSLSVTVTVTVTGCYICIYRDSMRLTVSILTQDTSTCHLWLGSFKIHICSQAGNLGLSHSKLSQSLTQSSQPLDLGVLFPRALTVMDNAL